MRADEIETQINPFIVELYRASRQVPAGEFKQWAFERLSEVIEFDSGIWVTATKEYGAQFHGIYLYNQSIEMMQNYEKHVENDFLAAQLMKYPGISCDPLRLISREEFVELPIYYEHAKKYGLEQTISTGHIEKSTGVWTFVSLYRADPERQFSERDIQLKQFLFPHFIEANTASHFVNLYGPDSGAAQRKARCAICDSMGVIYQAEAGFTELLTQEWAGWVGPMLPDEVVNLISDAAQQHKGEQITVKAEPVGELFKLEIRPCNPLDSLTAREREIAEALIAGQSYKQIAVRTGISPSTVTNHANKIYKKLGVSGKGQLGQLDK